MWTLAAYLNAGSSPHQPRSLFAQPGCSGGVQAPRLDACQALQQLTRPASEQVHFQALGKEWQEVVGEVGEGQHWKSRPFFLSAGATPIEVLGAFRLSQLVVPAAFLGCGCTPPSCLCLFCGLLHLLSVASVSLIGMLVIGFRVINVDLKIFHSRIFRDMFPPKVNTQLQRLGRGHTIWGATI